jgi:zinc D-Ala-D-Ala carboxypeptidase
MKLSKHLTLHEMTRSGTAKRKGVSNQPTPQHIQNMKILAEKIFEPIRRHFNSPIYISSGYRSAALNKVTPGASKTSQHSKGEAVDLDQHNTGSKITNKEIFNWVKDNLDFDQLIAEFKEGNDLGWVHVSYNTDGAQRKQILIATKGMFGTKYSPYSKELFAKIYG